MTHFYRFVPVLALSAALGGPSAAPAANFTTGDGPAVKFGVHEITLTGDGAVANPFDTIATVAFTPPSGAKGTKTVRAFYDGGNTWRARVYVSEAGKWNWASACQSDKGLDGRKGSFQAAGSKLRGRLLPHPKNPRQWKTEDGRWFLSLNDTAYFLLCNHDAKGDRVADEDALRYVRDDVAMGITSVRCFLASRPKGFNESSAQWRAWYFPDKALDRLRLENLQGCDHRLRLLLDEYPDVAIQLILFPLEAYARDDRFWAGLSKARRERLLRNLMARFAAYPQIFWLITNDAHYGEKFPNSNAMAREVGAFLEQHDPWRHPRSTGHARRLSFYFGREKWATYVHIEHAHDLGAAEYQRYEALAKPVFLGEDRYEQDHGPRLDPRHMRYWQRRLFWAWLLSGGSANYGGRWGAVHPYSETGKKPFHLRKTDFREGLHGLDSVRFIRDYFPKRQIELSDFVPDPALVSDPGGGPEVRSPKLMRRGHEEYLIYHPNAASDGRDARVNASRKARVRIELSQAAGPFAVEWHRALDGVAQEGSPLAPGKLFDLEAPWPGHDVVLRLTRKR